MIKLSPSELIDRGFDVRKIWYHCTDTDFDAFDIEKFGTNEPRGDYVGKAAFLADTAERARAYDKSGNGIIKRVFLKMSNPVLITKDVNLAYWDGVTMKPDDDDRWQLFEKLFNDSAKRNYFMKAYSESEKRDYFIEQGYDGMIDSAYGQAAIFHSEQAYILPEKKITHELSI